MLDVVAYDRCLRYASLRRRAGEGTKQVFCSEAELVDAAVRHLKAGCSPWGSVEIVTEWDYRHGRADILARKSCLALVALEAKLTRWQVACDQAYRSTAYASQAYVLLPDNVANRALGYARHFKERHIGLCSVTHADIRVLIAAPVVRPLMQWVTELAHSTFDSLTDASTESRSDRADRLCTA